MKCYTGYFVATLLQVNSNLYTPIVPYRHDIAEKRRNLWYTTTRSLGV